MSSDSKQRPMYELIQDDLIEKIQTGVYQEGDRIPSEQELIDTWKVSRTTATKALTELSLNGYIYRVQGKGSFVNPLGSHLSPSQYASLPKGAVSNANLPHKIGVIIPQFADYHSSSIIRGIQDALQFPRYFINLAHSGDKKEEEYALHYFLQSGHDGIILFPTNFEFYSDTILRMTLDKYPLVLIDRIFPGIQCMSVTCDNAKGCELGVSHLTGLGHTNIAFIADAPYREQVTHLRYNSYLNAMSTHGLMSVPYENMFQSREAARLQADFLARVKSGRITAALVSNASAAIQLYHLCLDHDIRIPEDLSMVCFDNPNFYREPTGNFFTYLEQNSYDMGKLSALLLDQAFSVPSRTDNSQIVLQPRLVENKSTCRL